MKFYVFFLLVAFGAILAIFYSQALWWTVNRVAVAKRPVLLIMASYWLRMAVVAAGFYLVMDHSWDRLAASFAGFFIIRTLLVRRAREQAPMAGLVHKR
jgi:F1F0 ATPase subunit 2